MGMDGFVGRSDYLDYLESLYKAAPQSCAIYGRKRLGKTALLQKFCEYKRHIYISGFNGPKSDLLRNIEEAVGRCSGEKEHIEDEDELFDRLKQICTKRTVVILDNYSELMAQFPHMYSALSRFLSRDIKETKIFLIACDTDSSIFGRITNPKEIRPMNYLECAGFHPEFGPIQQLNAYAIVGGTPAYQHLLAGDPEDAIRDQFIGKMSVFSLEVESTMSDVTPKGDCIRVLYAMASGAESPKEIQSRSGLSAGQCQKAIAEMENRGMVSREFSDFDKRNWVCVFSSNILRFYFTVITKCRLGDDFFSEDKAFVAALDALEPYLSDIFRTITKEYVKIHYNTISVGKVRGGGPSGPDADYAVIARDADGRMVNICTLSRFHGDPMDMRDFKRLQSGSKKIKIDNKLILMLFSGCGFADDLKEMANSREDVVLVALEEMYEPISMEVQI